MWLLPSRFGGNLWANKRIEIFVTIGQLWMSSLRVGLEIRSWQLVPGMSGSYQPCKTSQLWFHILGAARTQWLISYLECVMSLRITQNYISWFKILFGLIHI